MAKRKLNYRFHNPNPVEVTADYILKVMIEANTEKVEKILQENMVQKRIWNTEIGQFRRRVYYRRLSGEAGTPRHAGSHSHRPHFGIRDRLVSGQISEKKTSDSQTKRTITHHPPSRHVTRPISSYDDRRKIH